MKTIYIHDVYDESLSEHVYYLSYADVVDAIKKGIITDFLDYSDYCNKVMKIIDDFRDVNFIYIDISVEGHFNEMANRFYNVSLERWKRLDYETLAMIEGKLNELK